MTCFNSACAEKSTMKTFFNHGLLWTEDDVVLVKNPIRVRIRINNTPEEIQKLHRVDMHVDYENPVGSREVGTWNKRLTHRDIGIFCEGHQIERGDWLPTEQKPRPPLSDSDFMQMNPGEKHAMDWQINLNDLGMLEGKHQYELFLAGNHVLPSVKSRVFEETQKNRFPLSVDTKSNTVTFTYTKQAKVPSEP